MSPIVSASRSICSGFGRMGNCPQRFRFHRHLDPIAGVAEATSQETIRVCWSGLKSFGSCLMNWALHHRPYHRSDANGHCRMLETGLQRRTVVRTVTCTIQIAIRLERIGSDPYFLGIIETITVRVKRVGSDSPSSTRPFRLRSSLPSRIPSPSESGLIGSKLNSDGHFSDVPKKSRSRASLRPSYCRRFDLGRSENQHDHFCRYEA